VCFFGFGDDFVVGLTGPAGGVGVLVLGATGAATPGFCLVVEDCHRNATAPPLGIVNASTPVEENVQPPLPSLQNRPQ
jgi:hypothetical protein